MGFKEWIVPQDKLFWDLLSRIGANLVACSEALTDLVTDYRDVAAKRERIKELEHAGDSMTHEMFDMLNRSFITPIDREDLSTLAHSSDDVADYIYAATNRIHLYELDQPSDAMKKLVEIIGKQTRELAAALNEMQSSKTRKRARERCIEVNSLENAADRTLNVEMGALFKSGDAVTILKHKDILEMLETATDKCEDVSDVIQDVIRKTA